MIACSFPNVMEIPIFGCRGLIKRYLLVSIENIKKE